MKPIRNNILIKPDPADEVSEGGIFIPGTAMAVSNRGTVIAVGNGINGKPMPVQPGDKCFRVKGWGTEVLIDDELHYLVNSEAILAKA